MTKTDSRILEVSYALISMVGFVFMGTAFLFLLNIEVTQYHYPVLSFIGLLALKLVYRLSNKKIGMIRILVFYISFLVLSFLLGELAYKFWDFTVDGRWYHTEAIVRMSDGWNPVYSKQGNIGKWSYYYSKATWYFSASAGKFLGEHEKSKIYTMLLEVAVVLMSIPFFKSFLRRKNYWIPLVGALILLLNPINWAQKFTFYQDAALGICIMLMIFMLYFVWNDEEGEYRKINLYVLFLIAALLSNIKFTGLVFASFILFIFLITEYKRRGKERGNSFLVYCIVSFLIITVLVGFSPYVKNTIEHKNPFYPLIGKDSVDIMTDNTPVSLRDMNYAKKFMKSLLIVPDNDLSKDQKVDINKLFDTADDSVYAQPDQRIRGFGLLSFVILPLSIIMLVIYMISGKNINDKEHRQYFTVVIIQFALIAIVSREIWWARYFSYFWLIPAWVTVIYLDSKLYPAKVLSALMIAFVLSNSTSYLYMALPKQMEYSDEMKEFCADRKSEWESVPRDKKIVDFLNKSHFRVWVRDKLDLPAQGVIGYDD